ncbi:MATE family efflux transporter [Listeria monocytogenes]|nr:MATE family efflux transporter [Listeria monocytogenes]
MKHSDNYYLTKASIPKAIAHLSIPMMLGMSVGVIYNIINAFFIGLLHDTSMLTAVTLGLPMFTVLMAIGNMFGVGGGTYISRLLGKEEGIKAKQVSAFVLYGSLVLGILCAILLGFLINPVTHFLGADATSFLHTKNYTLALLICSPFIIANFALEQVVRAEGASRVSMNGMIIATVINLVFDPLLILYFDFNVVGAAVSVGLASLFSLIYYAWYLEKKSDYLSIRFKWFKATKEIVQNVFKIGVSELLLSLFLIVTTLVLNHYSMIYGQGVVAGFGVALRVVQLPEFICMGLYMGIIPLLAYNYGSGNIARFEKAIRATAISIGLIVLLLSSLVFIFRFQVMHLFSDSQSVITLGVHIMVAMLISSLFSGFTGLFTSTFQAIGKAIPATIMSVSQGIIFIPVIILGQHYFGLMGVIWSLTATEILTCIIGVTLFTIHNIKIASSAKTKDLAV